ncbi:hypothetical protein [Nocardia sp. NRRL S-836]|uniref:hypothetical protein n=1 Tax=Nocardia sp. NRRL S-836 TaxID=1519492 RepID=UPI0006AF08F5|nr:hypothetical protein [Nocardia sp. NRRL S-836]KOV81767.1 hypothetical protein ADL03_27595 [Nocardia sp. NRRL S-836]
MMANFIGRLDGNGEERTMIYRRLKEVAHSFGITSTTPEGPANLLEDAREMFALLFYRYKMLTTAAAAPIFAVEDALKLRLTTTSPSTRTSSGPSNKA